eukprot:2289765-Amphidinium_carterae.1
MASDGCSPARTLQPAVSECSVRVNSRYLGGGIWAEACPLHSLPTALGSYHPACGTMKNMVTKA